MTKYSGRRTIQTILGAWVALLSMVAFVAPARAAFTPPVALTAAGAGFSPQVDAQSGSIVHAVWAEDVNGVLDIIYSKSTNGGNTWNSEVNLSNTADYGSYNPVFKVDTANTIHVAWEEDVAGNQEIYYRQSTDGGATFSTVKNLSNDAVYSVSPSIDTGAANRIHVGWVAEVGDYSQILYTRSTDLGVTFSAPVNVSGSSYNADVPIVRSKGGTVGVVWQGGGPVYGLYRKLSADNGATFGSALQITADSTTPVSDASLAIDGSNRIHIVASRLNTSTGTTEVYHYRSTDNGATFSSGTNLSNTTENTQLPIVFTTGADHVQVAWSQNYCTDESCFKRLTRRVSTDGGATFGSVNVTRTDTSSIEDSDVEIQGGTAFIVYQESNTVFFMKGS